MRPDKNLRTDSLTGIYANRRIPRFLTALPCRRNIAREWITASHLSSLVESRERCDEEKTKPARIPRLAGRFDSRR